MSITTFTPDDVERFIDTAFAELDANPQRAGVLAGIAQAAAMLVLADEMRAAQKQANANANASPVEWPVEDDYREAEEELIDLERPCSDCKRPLGADVHQNCIPF